MIWVNKRNGSLAKLRALYAAQNGQCFYCGRDIYKAELTSRKKTRYDRDATVDHLWPRSRGNANAGNIVWACAQCNHRKATRQPTPAEIGRFEKLMEKVA